MRTGKGKNSLYYSMIFKMVIFLILPFLAIAGVFFGKLLQDGEKNYRNTLTLVMEQAESARNETIDDILRVADRISSYELLKGFLLTKYSYRSWNYYSDEVVRMVSGGLSYENRIVPKIYFANTTLPRGYDMFYRLEDISRFDFVSEFLAADQTEQWITPAMVEKYSFSFTPFANHYTYMRKVYSEEGLLYLLTLSVTQREMDPFLYQIQEGSSGGAPQVVESPERLLLNYSGKEISSEEEALTNGSVLVKTISFEKSGFPQKLTYIWGNNPQRIYFLFGLAVVLLFGCCSILINIQFVKRIFAKLLSCVNRFETSIETGKYESQPLTGELELRRFTATFNALTEKIRGLLELTEQQADLAKESQLKILRQEINPHFLYNTLEVFAYRMELHHHAEEADAIASFSGMLRYSLSKEGKYAAIREELEQVRKYIQVQKLKYPSVRFEADISPELLERKMIRFLLQPLVENSFTHGYQEKPLFIKISCTDLGNGTRFEIYDNGKGIAKERLQEIRNNLKAGDEGPEIGIGLGNIDQRLKLFYSEASALQIESCEGGGGNHGSFSDPPISAFFHKLEKGGKDNIGLPFLP